MSELTIQIVGGLIVAGIVSLFSIFRNTGTIIQGVRIRKTGKWIIFISALMILGGLVWASNGNTHAGLTLAGYGLIAFVIGKVVAWFQQV